MLVLVIVGVFVAAKTVLNNNNSPKPTTPAGTSTPRPTAIPTKTGEKLEIMPLSEDREGLGTHSTIVISMVGAERSPIAVVVVA